MVVPHSPNRAHVCLFLILLFPLCLQYDCTWTAFCMIAVGHWYLGQCFSSSLMSPFVSNGSWARKWAVVGDRFWFKKDHLTATSSCGNNRLHTEVASYSFSKSRGIYLVQELAQTTSLVPSSILLSWNWYINVGLARSQSSSVAIYGFTFFGFFAK